ncbi:MAG: Npun_R2821/Npun_R2822 family protein [Hassallia sp.]
MNRGIYIVANDRVMDNAIALINSIRFYDQDTPIVMIPYNENYQAIAEIISNFPKVNIYENLEFIQKFSEQANQICGQDLFERPNLLRKLICWFGIFDEFLYIDTDIIVFNKIIDNLKYLTEFDFVCYDYQHLSGIYEVFKQPILENKVFSSHEVKDVFNSGFWASKKHVFSEEDVFKALNKVAAHPEYFDLSTVDQPILNYLVLKHVPRRFNIVNRPGKAPGNWAGSPHFQAQGHILIDSKLNQPLQFIHWAGMRIEPGCPYWEIWEYYRNLNPSLPQPIFPVKVKKSSWQQTLSQIKTLFRFRKK